MNKRVNLGRIGTVPIQGSYSLALLVLVLAGFAAWQFQAAAAGYGIFAYAVAGLFSALLFVWTVYAHEAAHVAAARHFGARVKGVTLTAVGGETAISGEPASPWQGIVVAVSGPAVSALCGVVGLGGGIALLEFHAPRLLALCFLWVGVLCLVLAIANMLPAAPLDGGHVLQSLLWAGTGNRVRASAISGFTGQIVGAALVVGAGWLVISGASPFAVLAGAVVGWPLWRGAATVRRTARLRVRLAGMTVGQLVDGTRPGPTGSEPRHRLRRLFDRHVPTATPDEPLADVLERCHARPQTVRVVRDEHVIAVLDAARIRAAIEDARPAATGAVITDVWPGVPERRAAAHCA